MLVRGDLGFPSLVFLLVVVVVVPVIVFIVRQKWRQLVARREEVNWLLASASEESARVEFEARETYFYTANTTPSARVSVSVPTSASVPLGSPLKPQYQCAVCFCPTTTRCAKCKAVRYCSGNCQIIHWRQGHKYECRPYVSLSPINDVGGSSYRQADCKDQSNGFDTKLEQPTIPAETFPENSTSESKDGVGVESLSHRQGTNSTSESTHSFENNEIVKPAYQTLVSPARKSTGLGKNNKKKSTLSDEDAHSETSSSSFWTDDGSNQSSLSEPSTNSSVGTILNRKSSSCEAANGYMANHTTKSGYNSNFINGFNASKVIDGSGPTGFGSRKSNDDSNLPPSKFRESKNPPSGASSHRAPGGYSMLKDDKAFSGLPSSGPERSNDIFSRSASKISKLKVVDQFKPSKLSRQESLEGGSETTHRYSFKGLFPYEMFVKLYNRKKFELQPFGLKNCGNSCYANAVLQCLIYTPPLTAYLLQGIHSKACDKRGWCLICEFEGLVMKAKDGGSPLSPIRILTHIENIGSNLGHGREEDAHEFLRYVIDALQSVCIKEAGKNVLNSLEEETTIVGLTFGGYLRSKISCMKCGGKSERHERMMDLTVEIEGNIRTLEEALDKFTCTEILDGENKYKCSRCKSYEKAKKKMTLLEAPNVLTIALKRFESGKFGKLNKTIRFPDILDMAPYVSGTSDKSPIYRLYGLVVHIDMMNAAVSGHYVSYVKNVQNRWFKFDDSMVKEVDLQHVLTKGAYMLLYARCSPRAPRSIRNSLIHDPKKHRTPPSVIPSPLSTEPWDIHTYHPVSEPRVHHRTLEEESSSSSSDNSGFFSESCSCTTETSGIEDDYWRNTNLNSSDSDTSSSSSFPSPLYSRLSRLYGKECRNLDCNFNCNSGRVTKLDRLEEPAINPNSKLKSTTRGKFN